MEAEGEVEFGRAVPGRTIDDQDDLFAAARPFRVGEYRQRYLHGGRVDGG